MVEATEVSRTDSDQEVFLEVNHLIKWFPIMRGFMKRIVGNVRAIDDITFEVRQGETLAMVGESGCGKTTTARCVMRAIEPTAGEILFMTRDGRVVDLASMNKILLRELRGEMQMVFQDPFTSLNPRMSLLDIVGEPLLVHGVKSQTERADRVAELLRLVGLRPEYMRRFPHAFSGGERQRIGIARALALNPRLVVLDEPVSALDVSVQAQVINLLEELQEQLSLTYLFVAHDLSVVRHIADRVLVMYVGKIAELGDTEQVFHNPKHPYTEALLLSVPIPDPRIRRERFILEGEVASPANPPSGCYFHPRCRYAQDVCRTDAPVLREIAPGHMVSCHRADELTLQGLEQATILGQGNGASSPSE